MLLWRGTSVSESLNQTAATLCNSSRRVKSMLLVLATTRILLLRTFCRCRWSCEPTGSDYPGGFSTAEE